jgi:hypothetical protein
VRKEVSKKRYRMGNLEGERREDNRERGRIR